MARGVGAKGVGRLLGYATHAAVAWMYGPAQLASMRRVFPGLLAGKAEYEGWPYDRRYARPLLAGLAAAVVVLGMRVLLPAFEGLQALLFFAPLALAVFSCTLVSLGLYPSDRWFLTSFGDAVRNTLGRRPAQ